MTVEVVIPALRQEPVEWLVMSLLDQTVPPDAITIVSNETQPFAHDGVPTRLVRFQSSEYLFGELDVALRQNVGIYEAVCDVVIIQGDDQIAPPTMIEDTLAAMEGEEYIWGNHRLVDFATTSYGEIRLTHPSVGKSREVPIPPAWHGFYSCYGGMFAAKREFLCDFGAFDMAFNGMHGSEDQQLGYRLMKRAGMTQVRILEPPFSWHGIELKGGDARTRSPWLEPVTNGCGILSHDFAEDFIEGVRFIRCRNCPAQRFSDEWSKLFRDQPIIRYRPELVRTQSIWL